MDWLENMVKEIWATFLAMSPYLLFGFLVAGFLSVFISRSTVERHLGGDGMWPVVKAALLGIPLPLCSCGVIPVAASLRKHGSSRGATVSFLLATPQTGVDSILVTYSLLGPVFAIFRPLAALLTGILGGGLTNVIERNGGGGPAEQKPAECTDECCSGHHRRSRWVRALQFGFLTLPGDIGSPMLAGMIVAGVIATVIPEDFLAGSLGAGIGGIVAMMLLGIPVYVCATASVPIAAALLAKGASPGAALAFLITGPATNAATIATLWKLLGLKSTIAYLVTIAASAILGGLALNSVFQIPGVPPCLGHTELLPPWAEIACAVILLGVLAASFIKKAGSLKGTTE